MGTEEVWKGKKDRISDEFQSFAKFGAVSFSVFKISFNVTVSSTTSKVSCIHLEMLQPL